MAARTQAASRDRAILIVRAATVCAVVVAAGLSWAFGNLAEAFFSGKPAPAPAPPTVPVAGAPTQHPRAVVQTVVHHPNTSRPTSSGSNPRPPGTAPAPAAPPAPPPACHSTPTKPC